MSRHRPRLRIATRGSRLALAQAHATADALRQRHDDLDIEIVVVRTEGDQRIDEPMDRIAGKGAFTREIERALLDGRADLAVHSLKDLPTEQPDGLRLVASPLREDPRDALVAARWIEWRSETPEARRAGGLVVATSSPRRRAQLLRLNPRLRVEPLRGNVPTRIQKVVEGHFDAIVLALAGIHRLELHPPYIEVLDFEEMLPAPGQGALGLQVRADDAETAARVAVLDDESTSRACRAERGFLHALGGGCRVPIAALARVEGERMRLDGLVASPDGARCLREALEGPSRDPESLGRRLAERLLQQGAEDLLRGKGTEEPHPPSAPSCPPGVPFLPLRGRRIVVTRDEDIDGPLSRLLLGLGAEVVCLPLVRHHSPLDETPLLEAARVLDTFDWIVFTSVRGVETLARAMETVRKGEPGTRKEKTRATLADYTGHIACVGPGTARRVEALGGRVRLIPREARGAALGDAFNEPVRRGLLRPGSQVLFPRADRAGTEVVEALLELGVIVHDVEAYRTVSDRHAAARLRDWLCPPRTEGTARNEDEPEIPNREKPRAAPAGGGEKTEDGKEDPAPEPGERDGRVDAVVFASPSAIEALFEVFDAEAAGVFGAEGCATAVIGPTTGEALRRRGVEPTVTATRHTFDGLAEALTRHFCQFRI